MVEIYYYHNYELDDCTSIDLSEKEAELLDACIWLVDNRSSIRKTAKNFNMSKSYLHSRLHKTVKGISYELYKCVTKQLKINFAHRTSGRSW